MGAALRRGTLDLRSLDLSAGGTARITLPVSAPTLELGGQAYRVAPPEPELRLDISRGIGGVHMRLFGQAELIGPCWRCLADARTPLSIHSSEFAAEGRPAEAPFDEDLDSIYLERDRLDLSGWLRDALVEALPATILCRDDCPGLCATCGAQLARDPCGCAAGETDPRWAALGDLAGRLRGERA